MKALKIIVTSGLVALVVLLLVPAQKRKAPTYNATSEIAVRGTVQQVEEFYCPVSLDKGIHLMVSSERGPIQVHVAPGKYLRGNNLVFALGDQIEVVGSLVRYKDADALIARTVTHDGTTVALRNASGKAIWAE